MKNYSLCDQNLILIYYSVCPFEEGIFTGYSS